MTNEVQTRASAIMIVEKARELHRYHINSGHFRDVRGVYRGTHVPTALAVRESPAAVAAAVAREAALELLAAKALADRGLVSPETMDALRPEKVVDAASLQGMLDALIDVGRAVDALPASGEEIGA